MAKPRLSLILRFVAAAALMIGSLTFMLYGRMASANGFAVGKKGRNDFATAKTRTTGLRSHDEAIGVDSLQEGEVQQVDEMLHNKRLFPFGRRRIVAYAGMRYGAKGEPNIREMISKLKDLGVNCYAYLIDNHSEEDIAALPHFCDLASRAGLEVWVVLVPPTEEPRLPHGRQDGIRYPPYGLNYVEWAREISTISKSHSNLTLLMIDDFLYNLDCFTPKYMARIHNVLKQANRRLLLGLTIYADQLAGLKKIDSYKPYIDAVEWGYQHNSRVSPDYGISAKSLPAEIYEYRNIFPHRLLIPCIYFTPHSSWSRKATVSYLKDAMTSAYEDAGVAFVFRTPKRGTVNYEVVKNFCHEHRISAK